MSEESAASVFRVMEAVKHRSTKLFGIACHKIVTFSFAAVRTSYLTACSIRIHCTFHSALCNYKCPVHKGMYELFHHILCM